jgi:hypothetical protein
MLILMFEIGRIARKIKARLISRQNCNALTLAGVPDFGASGSEVAEAVRQRFDVVERVTRMAEIYEAGPALRVAERVELFEMARVCNRCPHERKCARLVYRQTNLGMKSVDFCPNAAEYAALTRIWNAANAA